MNPLDKQPNCYYHRRATFNFKPRKSFYNDSTNSVSLRKIIAVSHNHRNSSRPSDLNLMQWFNRKSRVTKNESKAPSFTNLTFAQTKKKYILLYNAMIVLDVFCLLTNIIVIALSYKAYFESVKANFLLTPYIDSLRLASLVLSVLVCIMLTVHIFIKKNVKLLKYVLHIRLSYPKPNINYLHLICQLILHLVFPYPYITTYNLRVFYNRLNTISIDKLLLFITFFRLYFIMRIIKMFPSRRTISIWRSFQTKNFGAFVLKVVSQNYPLLFCLLKMAFLIFFSSLFVRFTEDFDTQLLIRINFIFKAVFTSGDTYNIPETAESKFIVAVTIFLGISLTSECGYKICEYLNFFKDNEIKAYHQIRLFSMKENKSNAYYLYFENFLRYKFSKLCSKSFFDVLRLKNNLKVTREKYFLQVLASLKVEYTINDFTKYIKYNYDPEIERSKEKLREVIRNLLQFNDYFTETLFDYYKSVCQMYYFTNQLTNIALLTFWIGGRFICEDFSKISKLKVIDLKSFDMRLKEFCVAFENKKLTPARSAFSPIKSKKKLQHNKKKAMNMCTVVQCEVGFNEELSPERISFSRDEDNEEEEDQMSSCYLGELHNVELLEEYEEYEEEEEESDDKEQ